MFQRPHYVGRGRPLALHRGPYGDVHRTSFGDVVKTSSGRDFARWVEDTQLNLKELRNYNRKLFLCTPQK